MTLRRFVAVCWLIERGHATTGACEIEGVSYTIFRQRVAASARLTERLKKATDTRSERRHEEAISIVMAHAPRNWLAAAWYLERTAPHLFSLRNVNRVDPDGDQPAEEQTPAEVLARHRALLLELAREDEARSANPPEILLEDQAKSQSRPASDSVEQINQTPGKQIGQL